MFIFRNLRDRPVHSLRKGNTCSCVGQSAQSDQIGNYWVAHVVAINKEFGVVGRITSGISRQTRSSIQYKTVSGLRYDEKKTPAWSYRGGNGISITYSFAYGAGRHKKAAICAR